MASVLTPDALAMNPSLIRADEQAARSTAAATSPGRVLPAADRLWSKEFITAAVPAPAA
jgi:hypothetical protein